MRIGNRVTEKDLRQWLDAQGWAGRSAKIDHLDLHAIQPPGWIQVFRFKVDVVPSHKTETHENDHASQHANDNKASTPQTFLTAQTFYGAIRDDERQKSSPTKIWVFNDQQEQSEKLSELSEGLITLRSGETSAGFLPLLVIFIGLVVLVATFLYWLNS